MILKGECLACSKLGACRESSETRVINSYTCSLFEAAPEAVYLARLNLMQRYGEHAAVRAMIALTHEEGEEDDG